MTDEIPLDGAAAEAAPDPTASSPQTHEQAEAEAAVAAETAANNEAEQAPAGTGPMVTPPPVAGWDDPPDHSKSQPRPCRPRPTAPPARWWPWL